MKKFFLTLSLSLITIVVFGQNTKTDSIISLIENIDNKDSLSQKIDEFFNFHQKKGNYAQLTELLFGLSELDIIKEKKLQAECYGYIAQAFFNTNKIDSALHYFRKSLKQEESSEIGFIYMNMSSCYANQNKIDSAIYYANQAEIILKKYKDYKGLCYLCYNNATLALRTENHLQAYTWLSKLLEYKKFYSTPTIEGAYYTLQASLQYLIGNNEFAIECLKNSIDIYEKEESQIFLVHEILLLASIYSEEEDYVKSNELYSQAMSLIKKYELSLQETHLLEFDNFIFSLIKQNKIEYAKNILKYVKKNSEPFYFQEKALTKMVEAELLYKDKKNVVALQKLNDIDTTQLIPELQKKYCDIIIEMSEKTVPYNFIETIERQNYLLSFLHEQELKKQVIRTSIEYETTKKEQENSKLKAEKATQKLIIQNEKQQKVYFFIIILALFIILIIISLFYRKTNNQKRLIENLQKELHHRVKNNLAIINRFVEALKQKYTDDKIISSLNELQNRVASINEVHLQLYKNADSTSLYMDKYIKSLVINVKNSFNKDNIKVVSHTVPEKLKMLPTASFPIGIIINEFLTNSFKYAFHKEAGIISINLEKKPSSYSLKLSDNGKGLKDGFDFKKDSNFGLRVIQLLCEQLDAEYRWNTESGLELVIDIPID